MQDCGVVDPARQLEAISNVADVILEAVASSSTASPGHSVRDVNDALLCAAYGRAYRCLRSIRQLAGSEEADDALSLTRALVEIVARSLWLVKPTGSDEREGRFDSARRSWAEDTVKALRDLHALGFEADDPGRVQAIATTLESRGVPRTPDVRTMLLDVGLVHFYPRVYRLTSDVLHFSVGAALDAFLERPNRLTGAGGRVSLKLPAPERSIEALELSTLTYGAFLEKCEPVVAHGATDTAREALALYMAKSGQG